MRQHLKLILVLVTLVGLTISVQALAAEADLEAELQAGLLKSKALVEQIQQRLDRGQPVDKELKGLNSLARNIRISHMLLAERFNRRQVRADALGFKAARRHADMLAAYRIVIAAYLDAVERLQNQKQARRAIVDELIDLLDQAVVKPRKPVFGSLPYRRLNYTQKLPVPTPVTIPAYKGGDQTVAPGDLQSTPLEPISAEIAALAESLNWNPAEIYQWVKNNIATQWYWGAMKGAAETLRQGSGNDCDQAALLVALLRSAGYPSRYVQGVIEFFPDIETVKNLTGVQDPALVADFLRHAGIPHRAVMDGPDIVNYRIEHIWVEARVPYANYRGNVIDAHGPTWLGLDTSIKAAGYTYSEPGEVLLDLPLSGLRDNYLQNDRTETFLEYLRAHVQAFLDQNPPPGDSYNAALLTASLNNEALNILPAGLQFVQVAVTAEYTDIPDNLIHRVHFNATDSNTNELFDITVDAYTLSNQALSLSYDPDTLEDQEIINSYGGLDRTPSYLVSLRPVLKLNDQRLSVSRNGLAMGLDFTLTVELISPNGSEQITNDHIVGNLALIGVVSRDTVMPAPLADEEKDAVRLLHEGLADYIHRWNQAENEQASLMQVRIVRPIPTVVTIGGVVDVTYLLNMPHDFEWKGIYIDADLRAVATIGGLAFTDTTDTGRTFLQLASLEGSVLEGEVLADNFQVDSISTARLLGLAKAAALTIHNIDSTNIGTVLPGLPFDQAIKDDITAAVAAGQVVQIPAQEIADEDWTGVGYVKENPTSGESGWMLSGLIEGGMTTWRVDSWPEYHRQVMQHPYSEPPNTEPSQAASILKIIYTDMQKGIAGEILARPLQVIVRDAQKRPVMGASVTFTIKAGGGKFTNNENTITVDTDYNGVAEVEFTLGEKTSDNPYSWMEDGYTYSQQVGQNIIDAALTTGTAVQTPFTAYGFPGDAVVMRKQHGDEEIGQILDFAGFISIIIEDQHGNPISNLPVNFVAGAAIENGGPAPNCTNPNSDTRPAQLFEPGADCLQNIPLWGECQGAGTSIQRVSNRKGCSAQVIMGGAPDAEYPIAVTSDSLSQTFHLYTWSFGNCSGDSGSSHQLSIGYVYPADQFGNNINAGAVGASIPVKARIFYLREEDSTQPHTIMCDNDGNGEYEPFDCIKLVGTRQYFTDTDFQNASLTIEGQVGTPQGNGIYTSNYVLQPGENIITISGSATAGSRKVNSSCAGCSVVDSSITDSQTVTYKVYGIEIELKPPPLMILDKNGLTQNDYDIMYEIKPAEYSARNAYVNIYKDGLLIQSIPAENQGNGSATLSRGTFFDVDYSYEAEVVVNAGSGAPPEVASDRAHLLWVAVKNDEDEDPIEELKFSNDGKEKKRYHLEIAGIPDSYEPGDLSGFIRIVAASDGQLTSPPSNDFSPAEYPLEFEQNNGSWEIKIKGEVNGLPVLYDKFILTNLLTESLNQNNDLDAMAKIYGGLGNKFELEINNVKVQLPIEPLEIIVLGIDGLRQDVLYPSNIDAVNDGGQYRVNIGQLEGLSQVIAGHDQVDKFQNFIMLPDVTAIFPSITLASWASIFTGKMPAETGIVGNEFFGRDLYEKGISEPERFNKPYGIISFGGGAFKGFDAYSPWKFLQGWLYGNDFFIPYQSSWVQSAPVDGTPQNNFDIMPAETVYENIATQPDLVEYFQGSEGDVTLVAYSHYARGTARWLTWDTELSFNLSSSQTLDKASWGKLEDYLEGRYEEGLPFFKKRNDVPFSALTVWYLPGMDHEAHIKGMEKYTDYFKGSIDGYIENFVQKLKDLDEFDDKLFIIVADHGMTAMPTDLKYKVKNWPTLIPIEKAAEAECKLNLKFANPFIPELTYEKLIAEKANNNLHIVEFAEALKMLGESRSDLLYKVLAPREVANVFRGASGGASKRLNPEIGRPDFANVIAALNGPMAHLYLRGDNGWNEMPNVDQVKKFAEILRLLYMVEAPVEANQALGLDEVDYLMIRDMTVDRLKNSIDKILVRVGSDYLEFIKYEANDYVLAPLNFGPEYVKGLERIDGLNNPDRSGDIVLIMKDRLTDATDNRYTTGVACKAWHGSLNEADSYVPLILAYPGGNKKELEMIIDDTDGCDKLQGCDGNWRVTDLIKITLEKQYGNQ